MRLEANRPSLASLLSVLALAACGHSTAVASSTLGPRFTEVVVPAAAATNEDPAAPAPLVFADEGDAGTIELTPDAAITFKPVGPSLIAVVGRDSEPSKAKWKTLEVERHVVGDELVQSATFTRPRETARLPSDWAQAQDTAAPGTTYEYRARLDHGEWSKPVSIRTGEPKHPPPALERVQARALGRYSVELTWDADTRAVAGYAVEVKREGEWILASLVNVGQRKFVHNHLTPKTDYEYRLAAFNAQGVSAFKETGAITTAETMTPSPAKPLAPCMKLPPEDTSSAQSALPRADLTKTLGVTLVSDPIKGNVGGRQLYGEYRGCVRKVGSAVLQGDVFSALEWTDEGFPLLSGILGAGAYTGAQVGLFAFSNGRYEQVNTAAYCGEPSDYADPQDPHVPHVTDSRKMTEWRGAFDDCQLDFPKM